MLFRNTGYVIILGDNNNCACQLLQEAYTTWLIFQEQKNQKRRNGGEQDGGGVSGCGVHVSPRIHQEYTFRHRRECKSPAESGQEYLTSGKEYIEPRKTL